MSSLAKRLTARQKILAEEFVNGATQTDAAATAGYSGDRRSLYNFAHKTLQKPYVQEYVAELRALQYREPSMTEQEASDKRAMGAITPEMALQQLGRILTMDARELFHSKWQLKDVMAMPPDLAKVVQSIHVSYDAAGRQQVKVVLPDRLRAVELAMKHLDLLNNGRKKVIENLTLDLGSLIARAGALPSEADQPRTIEHIRDKESDDDSDDA